MAESGDRIISESIQPLKICFGLTGEDAYWARVLASRSFKSPGQWTRDIIIAHLNAVGVRDKH